FNTCSVVSSACSTSCFSRWRLISATTGSSQCYLATVIIDGVTYFPARAVANAVGADIAWDNKRKTAKMTTKEAR
ncbi:hypothetical protein PPOP_1547, partial [Paenibacillus popilliae ATCC 14706]